MESQWFSAKSRYELYYKSIWIPRLFCIWSAEVDRLATVSVSFPWNRRPDSRVDRRRRGFRVCLLSKRCRIYSLGSCLRIRWTRFEGIWSLQIPLYHTQRTRLWESSTENWHIPQLRNKCTANSVHGCSRALSAGITCSSGESCILEASLLLSWRMRPAG